MKKKEYQENKRAKELEAAQLQAEQEEENEETPGETHGAASAADQATTKGPKITGLTGDLAIQKAGKNTRKKLLEEQKREELERQALKERI